MTSGHILTVVQGLIIGYVSIDDELLKLVYEPLDMQFLSYFNYTCKCVTAGCGHGGAILGLFLREIYSYKGTRILGLEERRKRERENRKNAILKAARKLFFEKGFRPVTVESIARKAELSKGSIYLYYNSKEEIYSQILLNDIDKFHDHIADILQRPSSASEALIRLAEIYVDFFLNDRELFRILMNFMLHNTDMNLPEDLSSHIIKTTNKTISIVEQVFRYGIETGEFPPDINLRMSRNAIWGLLNGIISLHLFTGFESKRVDVIRSTIKAGLDIYIRGLKVTEQPH